MNDAMTIIEGLKKIKLLKQKYQSQTERIANACAELGYENEQFTYGTAEEQQAMVGGLIKSCQDIVAEIENISLRISKTNIETPVTIELEGKHITKPIAGWILRRRELSALSAQPYDCLTDRGLQPKAYQVEGSDDTHVANVVRFFDPKKRDEKKEQLKGEPLEIDGRLEVVNATTQLLQL